MGSKDDARLLIHRIVTAYNSRDVDALVALYRPDITYWSAIDGLQEGADAVREHLDHLHATIPEEQMTAQTVITDGELIVVEFESTGTNPAGNSYTIEFTEVFELDDGKVSSIKVYLDPEEVERAYR
ncbi:MAG: nuclear transport factor 2 family protein [Acidobacteria bacterium]|nr:nuclear transport factor 2 family protein [Acidobacteriota bacterium]